MKTLIEHKYFFLIFIVSLAIYAQTTSYKFVFDDQNLIVKNQLIKSFSYIPDIFTKEFFNEPGKDTGYYRPLINFSFLIEYKLWKLNPTGFHITNNIIHAINTLLVSLLLLSFTKNKTLSLFCAFFFSIMPIHTSAVAYIPGRTDLLNTFFTILSLLLFLKHQTDKKIIYLISALISFFLSLLCKETSIVLPALIALYTYLNGTIKHNKTTILGFIATATAFILIRASITSMPPDALITKDIFLRVFTINKILFHYILLMLFPNNLHFERMTQILPISAPSIITAIIGNIILLCCFVAFCRKEKLCLFMGTFFILFLLPTIHIIPIFVEGRLFTAEHFLYLPSIAFITIIGIMLHKIFKTHKKTKTIIQITLAIWSIFFILQTINTNKTYANESIFYRHNLSYTPYSTRMLNNYANLLSSKGEFEKAFNVYLKSIEINPKNANTLYNLGTLFISTNQHKKAIAALKKAIALNPNRAVYYNNLGIAYSKLKKYRDAFIWQEKAHKLDISDADYIYNLGIFSLALKEYDQAKMYFNKAVNIRKQPEYLASLAATYFSEKKYKEALKYNMEALKIAPDDQEALFNTAICYLSMNDQQRALNILKRTVSVNPKTVIAQKAAYEINKLAKKTKRIASRT